MTSQIFKLALAAAAVAVSVPALAKAEDATFKRDGYTYVYHVVEKGDTKQIRGKYYPGGRSFALNVHNGRVDGRMNEAPVSFSLSTAKATGGELASN